MTWMQTYTGRAFDLAEPRAADVDLLDIAWALGRICRYNGHTSQHYSVAQHCCLVADALAADGHPDPVVLGGLLHDAAEAYTGDVSAPMKWASPALAQDLRILGRPIEAAICDHLGVPFALLHHDAVREYDRRILLDESEVLLGPKPRPWSIEGGPLGVTIRPREARKASGDWLARLHVLLPDCGAREALFRLPVAP